MGIKSEQKSEEGGKLKQKEKAADKQMPIEASTQTNDEE